MRCKEFRQNLFLYFSGELSNKELQEFESHRESCSECKKRFSEYQNISTKYTEIPQYDFADFQKENIKAIVERLAKERSILQYSKYIIAAAAVLLVAITSYINLINKESFDAMVVFEREKIGAKTVNESFELLPSLETEQSVFENISGQIEKLESTSFEVAFSFEDNPRLEKIKQRIKNIKNDNFFRSES